MKTDIFTVCSLMVAMLINLIVGISMISGTGKVMQNITGGIILILCGILVFTAVVLHIVKELKTDADRTD